MSVLVDALIKVIQSYGVTAVLIVGELLLLRSHRQKALTIAKLTVKYGKVEKDEDTDETTA